MNPTVLYVEDEEGDALFMQLAFEKAGLASALRIVGDGQDAFAYLEGKGPYADRGQHPLPTVILLDLNLPLVSGFEVLAWLRRTPQFKALPVVVFSSSCRELDKLSAKLLGANEYVEKPNSALEFGSVVQLVRERWLDLATGSTDSQK